MVIPAAVLILIGVVAVAVGFLLRATGSSGIIQFLAVVVVAGVGIAGYALFAGRRKPL